MGGVLFIGCFVGLIGAFFLRENYTKITRKTKTKKREKSGDNNLHRRAVFRVQCLTEPLAGNQLDNLGRVVRP